MDEEIKGILMRPVTQSNLLHVKVTFSQYKLVQDESFFDYKLLKAALKRNHLEITNFLLKLGCRVRNPNEFRFEETALHLAMKLSSSGDLCDHIIRTLLKNGASITDRNHNGETALYAGFKAGYKSNVEVALSFISSVNGNSNDFQTKIDSSLKCLNSRAKDNIVNFHVACVINHYKAIELFLRNGFDVNSFLRLDSAEFSGSNPLHYAAAKGDQRMFESFLKHGGDLSIKNSNGLTPLHIIYYNRRNDLMEIAFRNGNDTKFINCVDNNGVSHFHFCCAMNYPDMVKVFIRKGVDVNISISSSCSIFPGFTPLNLAIKYYCSETIQLLLASGADCSKVDEKGCTPLHMVFYNITNGFELIYENLKILDMLILKTSGTENSTDNKGLSLFHIVCTRNDSSWVHDFLKAGVEVNSCVISGKYSGYTALHFAVLYNQKDIVEMLLKHNAEVNIKTKKLQKTPLHLACNYNYYDIKFHEIDASDRSTKLDFKLNCKYHLDIVKLLLLYGADVEAKDSLGSTPLIDMCTVDKRNKHNSPYLRPNLNREINSRIDKIIEILLCYYFSNKANINAHTNSSKSILHVMCEKNFSSLPHLIKYLISKGANVNAVDNAGLTPLNVAVKSSKKEIVQFFLKHKEVNVEPNSLLISLQFAFKNYDREHSANDKDIFCALLEQDSDVDIKNNNKNKSILLSQAIKKRNLVIIKKLLNCGADINMEDFYDNSTIRSLIHWNRFSVTRYLSLHVSYAKVFETIFIHVQKLLALGSYVSEKVLAYCNKFYSKHWDALTRSNNLTSLDNIFDNCMEELDRMRLIEIDHYNSLYNILQKNAQQLSKYIKNSTFVEIVENQNIDNNFPLYSYLLKLKFKEGLKRSNFLKRTKLSLAYIIKSDLPDLCYDFIFRYLTDEDLANLNAAARSSHINNNSDDTQPSSKFQKKIQQSEYFLIT